MMKHFYALVFFLAVIFSGYAQVGVGTPMPDSSAQLDVVAKDRGVLIPRIPLKGVRDVTTIANGNVESLLVFNTANTSDLKPGYYYWYVDRWYRVMSSGDVTGVDLPNNIVIYDPINNQWTYIDATGTPQVINFEDIVRANETVTTLVNNQDGTYTYTSEDGTATTINVPADVINQFQEIIEDKSVVNEITNLIRNIGGNVFYDGDNFTYIDQDGNTQIINAEEYVKSKETVTTLVNNQDGTYTYTSEDGTATTINVPTDVINRFEEIVQNENVVNEITNLIKNVGGNVYYDGDRFTYLDDNGTTQVINIQEIVRANETVTALVNNQDGTYTYTSEDGTATTINVPADVINQFEEIVQNENVVNEITNLIKNVGGNVYYDGDQFTYLDDNGTTQVINIQEIVRANETVTALVNNQDGTYTYTSEDGTATTINVPADVINQFEEIVQNENVVNEITNLIKNVGGNVYYDGDRFTYLDDNGTTQVINIQEIVRANETVTTLFNNQDGTYTYTSEDGTATTINVPADVINRFEEIVQNENVLNEITNLIKNVGGNVYYDGDQFTYLDDNGTTQVINIQEIVRGNETVTTLTDNADGTFTYINEEGTPVTFDGNTTTVTDNGDGTYTIVNKSGDTVTLNVISDVADNIVNQGDIYNEIIKVIDGKSDVLVDNDNGTYTHTSVDGDVIVIDATRSAITDNGDGTYTIVNQDGDNVVINTNANTSVYDNTNSGLSSGNVQDAIDELVTTINTGSGVRLNDNG
ncbi:hypothetical protein SAMN02927921_03402, partial [Sinomicrobium oceani]